jgi:1-acyl-sn-glycerol-3-phosphate acyltransferase
VNEQPFRTPPRHWAAHLSPWWVRLFRSFRRRSLRRGQKMLRIDVQNLGPLRQVLKDGAGVLITPNHSFHYDSYVLFEASDRLGRPFHFLTAWQVFAMSNRFERWSLQRHGCFSIDRESNDMQAFRQSVAILQESPYPLVIFPEGDIYHTNDRVTPFRDGAAAIALAAAKRAERPTVCVPCALKCWYVMDPTPELNRLMDRLEQRMFWRPRPDLSLTERVYRLANGALALKELEYLGRPRGGKLTERTAYLSNELLRRQEERFGIPNKANTVPERVKELRRYLITQMEKPDLDEKGWRRYHADMEDLFFVTQLYSYPGDYLSERPTLERLAETLDKFEEDLLRATYPSVRGSRRVVVRFGEPIPLPRERQKKDAVANLTRTLQEKVQGLLDELNHEGKV